MKTFASITPLALTLALAACSPAADSPAAPAPDASAPGTAAPDPAGPAPSPQPPAANAKVISLEGLGDLRLGQAVPAGGSWASRGAQIDGACQTVSSPDYPGVYAIVSNGVVRRITVGQRSDVTLVEGVGVGSTEQEVQQSFAGFRSEPHKYENAPARYLTAPNAASGDPAVRFEIGQDGKVRLLHVGMMPQLAYVEGCA